MSDHYINASGLLCPLPVIRTQDAIKRLHTGDVLDVQATDPGTLLDIPAWCRVHGHDLIRVKDEKHTFRFRIRVC